MQRHRIPTLLFWFYLLGVLIGSVVPVEASWGLLDAASGRDKWAHGLVYFAGAAVFFLWFRLRSARPRSAYFRSFFWLCVLGAVTEFIQIPLPYRSGNLPDFLADLIGGSMGTAFLGLYAVLHRYHGLRRSSRALVLSVFVLLALVFPGMGFSQGLQWWHVGDVRPGMKGVGYTTVQGREPLEFQVEVLGVLSHVLPDMDIILARLSGGPLEKTGVFSGMSGSPVYVDGKLLGAVAYSWPFAREAIAGIVPFEAMKGYQERAAHVSRSAVGRTAKSGFLSPEALARGLLGDRDRLREAVARWSESVERLFRPRAPSESGVTPIPLAWIGHPVWRALVPDLVPATSVSPAPLPRGNAEAMTFLTAPEPSPQRVPLKPGMPIAVPLVQGDWQLTAFGTLTAVEGSRIYAFGHQLFNLGSIRFPMHAAQVLGVLPSLQASFVMARGGAALGVLDTDIWFTISGLLGPAPPMTRIQLEMASEGQVQQFSYQIVRHPLLTPYLIQQITTANMVMSPLGQLFDGSIRVELNLNMEGLPDLTLRNVFSGLNPIGESTQYIAAVLLFLMNNPFQTVDIDRARLSITQSRRSIQASLVEVRVLTQEIHAGERLPMVMSIHPRQDRPIARKIELRLPEELAPGKYVVFVGGAEPMNRFDAMFYYRYLHFKNLRDMLKLLRNLRQNDGLYVRLVRYSPTLMAEGQVYRNLPLQIYHQMRSQGTQGAHVVVPLEVVLSRRFEWPYIIDGMQQFQIEIKPKAQTQETRPITTSKEGP